MNTNDPIDVQATDVTPTRLVDDVPRYGLAVPPANPYMAMVETAMASGRGIEQLDKLLDLQIKWDAEQARKAWHAAMAAFKADPIVIEKRKLVEFATRDNDVTSYKHATLADVVDAVVAGMGRHGLSHRWDVNQEGGTITVTCYVTHRDGHSEKVTMQAAPDSSGKKNSIQQVASAVTYLQRYTLMAAAGVAAKDVDDDGIRYESKDDPSITEEQAKILQDLIGLVVNDERAFLDWCGAPSRVGYRIETIADLPAKHFDAVHAQLARLQKQKAEANG